MKYTNTRQGNTQEVVYKNGPSKFNLESHRVLFSEVRSRIKYGMTPLFNNNRCVEDAEQRHLSIHLFDGKGFTLIELLVVVLIIGILAAVALPQYQYAVEKSRVAEALVQLNSLQKAVDVYLLENGYPTNDEHVSFLGDQQNGHGKLAIDTTGSLDCTVKNESYCVSRDFIYTAFCDPDSCYCIATRVLSGYENESSNTKYELILYKNQDAWTKACYYLEEHYPQGKKLCDSLQTQGWISEAY